MGRLAIVVLCALAAAGQSNSARRAAKQPIDPEKAAWIHGSVVSDLNGEPLLRAQIFLRPVAAGSVNSVLAETDEKGHFVINRISPGTYSLVAQREGYLVNTVAHRGPWRMPPVFRMDEGTRLRDITFRMRPWSVIAGKIRFDDAEPAIGAAVQVYREAISRGRHSMHLISTARANDHGEYRIAGLSPGAYFVSATRTRPVAADLQEQEAIDDSGKPRTEYRYATTFFPGSQKLADALPVRVDIAQEVGGIDIFLKPVPAVKLRGRVLNGLTGQVLQPPPILLRRVSADGRSSIHVPVDIQPYDDGYEINGITSGPYLVHATTVFEGRRLTDTRTITVTDASIDGLDLVLAPEHEVEGTIRFDDTPRFQLSTMRLSFEPRGDLNTVRLADVSQKGTFTAKLVAGEHYDLYLVNAPADYYIRSIQIANLDVGEDGIPGNAGGPNVPLTVTLSSKSGQVQGRVLTADGNVASGAVVTVVPDPSRGRAGAYQTGAADEYGIFRLSGFAPGRYTVLAYYDEPPCDLYDDVSLLTCRALGRGVTLEPGTQSTIEMRLATPR